MNSRAIMGRTFRREVRKLAAGTLANIIKKYERRFYVMTVIAIIEALCLILVTILFMGTIK